MKKNRSSLKGFTLIELLVVIILLGVLVSFIVGNFFTSLQKGRDARRKADLEQIQRALEIYYEDKKAYPLPENLYFKLEFSDEDTGKVYMKKVPDDPLGSRHYGYETDETGSYYKLYACLENTQQILPYLSSPSDFTCSTKCSDEDKNEVDCIWGISSTNTNP